MAEKSIKKETTEAVSNQSKSIVPQKNTEVQFDPETQVKQAEIAAKALMSVIQQKKKKVEFNGEQYLEFEDWQTIAQFYSHTTGIEWTRPIEEMGKIVGYEAKAVIYNRDGLVVGGAEAACMNDEGNWAKKPKFQLRSMAQTRAMAKALRSRFGFVAVLAGFKPTPAEEMIHDKGESLYFCEEHDDSVKLVPAGTSKQGKAYKAFWSCGVIENNKYCKARLVNSDGQRVKQNPESGEMMVDKAEIDMVETAHKVFNIEPIKENVNENPN